MKKAPDVPAGATSFEITLSVVGYREDGEWVALALEMDLRGYGKTFDAAMAELDELLLAQLSFALQKREPSLIYHPAEPVYWRLFADTQRESLTNLATGSEPTDPDVRVAGMQLPPPHVIASLAGQYQHS